MIKSKKQSIEVDNHYHKRFYEEVKVEVEEIENRIRENSRTSTLKKLMWSYFNGC